MHGQKNIKLDCRLTKTCLINRCAVRFSIIEEGTLLAVGAVKIEALIVKYHVPIILGKNLYFFCTTEIRC